MSTPTFVVLYNGVESQPERRSLLLSDAYTGSSDDNEPNLELVVTQLNINDGFNEDLKQQCPELFGYCRFVSLTRSYREDFACTIAEAVDKAINTCINEGILADFLRKNRKEVFEMSIYEYNEALHNQTLLEEGREEGRAEGRAEGRKEAPYFSTFRCSMYRLRCL